MAFDPYRTVDWQVSVSSMVVQPCNTTVRVPPSGGQLSERLYEEILPLTNPTDVILFAGPSESPALANIAAGSHVELSVTSIDGAHSIALYMAAPQVLVASGGALDQIAFGGSYTPVGDSTGLAYDSGAQSIHVTVAGMYIVRCVLSLINLAS